MIISMEGGSDIPAYYSRWFYNRIKEGYVLVRNPYHPMQVTRYLLNPSVVDCLVFCTKDPEPMLERLDEIRQFGQFWGVTVSPYGKEMEPYASDKSRVLKAMQKLSGQIGIRSVNWCYGPVFLSETYTLDFHIKAFERMADILQGYVDRCVVSFMDFHEKAKRNFIGVQALPMWAQAELISAFAEIGSVHGIRICCENRELEGYGAVVEGCMNPRVIERAIGCTLAVPFEGDETGEQSGGAVGLYRTCGHGCVFCHTSYDGRTADKNRKRHNPESPFLIGGNRPGDVIEDANQCSWKKPICYSHLSVDMI